jgi:hypothetical protein
MLHSAPECNCLELEFMFKLLHSVALCTHSIWISSSYIIDLFEWPVGSIWLIMLGYCFVLMSIGSIWLCHACYWFVLTKACICMLEGRKLYAILNMSNCMKYSNALFTSYMKICNVHKPLQSRYMNCIRYHEISHISQWIWPLSINLSWTFSEWPLCHTCYQQYQSIWSITT